MPQPPNRLGPEAAEADPVLRRIRSHLRDEEALARWIRSVRSMIGSASFRALLDACGTLDGTKAWLDMMAKDLPRETKDIERLNVWRPDPAGGKDKKTTVSLDPELWSALVAKTGSGDKATAWLRDTARKTTPQASGFSRAMQTAIFRYVSGHQDAGSHEALTGTSDHPISPDAPSPPSAASAEQPGESPAS